MSYREIRHPPGCGWIILWLVLAGWYLLLSSW